MLTDTGLAGTVTIDKVRQFFDHPGFVEPFIDGVRDAVAGFLAEGIAPRCRARAVLDPQHPDGRCASAPARATSTSARAARTPRSTSRSRRASWSGRRPRSPTPRTSPWQLVYQSRSGPPSQPWLEPDVCDVIETLPAAGVEAVAIVPLGFVIGSHGGAVGPRHRGDGCRGRGGSARGAHADPGVDPAYVAGLVDLDRGAAATARRPRERPHETALGPWFDVCRPGLLRERPRRIQARRRRPRALTDGRAPSRAP